MNRRKADFKFAYKFLEDDVWIIVGVGWVWIKCLANGIADPGMEDQTKPAT